MTVFLHIHNSSLEFSASDISGVILDSLLDSLNTLPFLLIAFIFIEFLEHRAQDKIKHLFARTGAAGPLAAALLGCVPQCGFSVLCANLYSSGVITLGTLIAVFLSTSDEAVILLAARTDGGSQVLKLLITKVIISLIFGYLIYFIEKALHREKRHHSHDLCEHDHCGCDEHSGILLPALIHTVKVFGFLLLFTLIIDFAIAFIGEERFAHFLLSESAFQPFLSALIGFIPNCASSILLTELYIEGTLSFGALISGLCVNSGAGMLILFRDKKGIKENLKILPVMYFCSVIPGLILHFAEV